MRIFTAFRRSVGLMLLGVLMSACTNQPQVIPTLAQLPSATPIPAVTVTSDTALRRTLPPEFTATATPTASMTVPVTSTPSVTPSATITDTPAPTATDLPTIPPEERARTSLLMDLFQDAKRLPAGQQFVATPPPPPPPPSMTPPPGILVVPSPVDTGSLLIPTLPPMNTGNGTTNVCPFFPAGGFGAIYASHPDIAVQLGCPEGSPPDVLSMPGAWQPFQQGLMVWLNGEIFVLKATDSSFQRYQDTYVAGTDPDTTGEAVPAGLFAPVRGFLKVWSGNTDVRNALGWGTAAETGAQATMERFAHGRMVWLPGRSDILVLVGSDSNVNNGVWRSFTGQF